MFVSGTGPSGFYFAINWQSFEYVYLFSTRCAAGTQFYNRRAALTIFF